jgi:Arc/MetJ-type ribon-helix-helix transcriptional regulator
MAATVAMPQKKLLRKLMKSGRWNSESEIVRYGIDLVRREVEREQLSPYPEHVLTEAYDKLTREEYGRMNAWAEARHGRRPGN